MYRKPTKNNIEWAMNEGWSKEDAERGYTHFDFDGTGLLEIERIDACYDSSDSDDTTDEDCAYEAERSGFCKIIPISELPNPFTDGKHDLRYFGWIDTPKNRERIKEYADRHN